MAQMSTPLSTLSKKLETQKALNSNSDAYAQKLYSAVINSLSSRGQEKASALTPSDIATAFMTARSSSNGGDLKFETQVLREISDFVASATGNEKFTENVQEQLTIMSLKIKQVSQLQSEEVKESPDSQSISRLGKPLVGGSDSPGHVSASDKGVMIDWPVIFGIKDGVAPKNLFVIQHLSTKTTNAEGLDDHPLSKDQDFFEGWPIPQEKTNMRVPRHFGSGLSYGTDTYGFELPWGSKGVHTVTGRVAFVSRQDADDNNKQDVGDISSAPFQSKNALPDWDDSHCAVHDMQVTWDFTDKSNATLKIVITTDSETKVLFNGKVSEESQEVLEALSTKYKNTPESSPNLGSVSGPKVSSFSLSSKEASPDEQLEQAIKTGTKVGKSMADYAKANQFKLSTPIGVNREQARLVARGFEMRIKTGESGKFIHKDSLLLSMYKGISDNNPRAVMNGIEEYGKSLDIDINTGKIKGSENLADTALLKDLVAAYDVLNSIRPTEGGQKTAEYLRSLIS